MEDNAGARARHGRARLIAGQRRIGHRMSRGHVGGQGTRQDRNDKKGRARIEYRAAPESRK